jgi:hypothetical protein
VAAGAVLYCRHYAEDAPGLSLFVEAAQCMLGGEPLQSCNPTYTYPPIFAFVTIPLVPLPRVAQNLVWYLVTLGSVTGCVVLSARLARRLVAGDWSRRELLWLYGLGLALSVKFILATVGNQSYDAAVVLLVLAGMAGLGDDRGSTPLWAGASLAGAAALKATPVLFLPYLVVRRRYRAAAAMAAVLVAISVLPDLVFTLGRPTAPGSYLVAWLHQVAAPALTEKMSGNPHTFWFAANPNNNSLRGLVGLFIEEPERGFSAVLYAVYALYAGVVGLVILASRNGRAAPAIDGALLLISMLMLSPMSSQSHYIAVLLPLFGAVAVWLKGDPPMRSAAAAVLIATVVLTNATSKDLVGAVATQWAKEHRLLVSDALLLCAFYLMLALRTRLAPSTAPAPAGVGRPAA